MYEISLTLVMSLMLITAFYALMCRLLLISVVVFGIYSLLTVLLFMLLDAVDVAFTEAAVGGGFSLIMFLAALAMVRHGKNLHVRVPVSFRLAPAIFALAFVALMVYGTLPLPEVGNPLAPAHNYVAPYYLMRSPEDIGIPNVVTSVLASYRGYDTMGEVTVIFCSALGVLGLLIGPGQNVRRSPR